MNLFRSLYILHDDVNFLVSAFVPDEMECSLFMFIIDNIDGPILSLNRTIPISPSQTMSTSGTSDLFFCLAKLDSRALLPVRNFSHFHYSTIRWAVCALQAGQYERGAVTVSGYTEQRFYINYVVSYISATACLSSSYLLSRAAGCRWTACC